MTQRKRQAATPPVPAVPAPDAVSVRLLCILGGDGESWAPGEVLTVDAAQAAYLIEIGAAVAA
jgi:hypothetical protein